MTRKLCLPFAACFVLAFSMALTAQVPITVYPDPIQFGTIGLNSTGYPVTIFLSNVTTNAANVTGMNISGTAASDFAFYGANCVTTISGDQTCQMDMTFTPSARGNRVATLSIAVVGLSSPISIPLQGTGGNPVPTLTSLSPDSAYTGSPSLTLTIHGSGFMSTSVAYWQNNPLTTSYVSPTQIKAQVPASDLTQNSSESIYVGNPQPGGGFSASLTFNVIALDPYLSSASPTSIVAGAAPSPIILSGSNFMNGATVLWNGKTLPATYINSGQLQFQPTSAELSTAAIVQLAVSNPQAGGISSAVDFNVTYPAKITILDLPANDLVWDPFAQRIYASLPSSYGSSGNTVAVINPASGAVGAYHFAGSEPNQLALSGDSHFLYVGLNGDGSVQRFILPKFTRDINVSLGSPQYGGGPNLAASLQVSPANDHTFAVAMGSGGCCSGGPLEFFTDSTLLPDSITYPSINDIVFSSGTTLYGFDSGTLTQVAVSSTGGTVVTQWNSLVDGQDIYYDAGLIYSSDGQAFNPGTGLLVGTYDVTGACCGSSTQVLPDQTINRVFAIGNSSFFGSAFAITSYNLSQFTPLGLANLSQFTGATIPVFIRWGSNGLAFTLESGCCGAATSQVVLVQSPSMLLTAPNSATPAPLLSSLSPASATHGASNTLVTLIGSGFVPGSKVTWNGTSLYANYDNSTHLTLYVPASALAVAGTASVVVTNPALGGGSSTHSFTIN